MMESWGLYCISEKYIYLSCNTDSIFNDPSWSCDGISCTSYWEIIIVRMKGPKIHTAVLSPWGFEFSRETQKLPVNLSSRALQLAVCGKLDLKAKSQGVLSSSQYVQNRTRFRFRHAVSRQRTGPAPEDAQELLLAHLNVKEHKS